MRHILIAGLFVLFLVGSQPTPSFAVSIVLPPTGQTTCQDMDGLPIPCAGTGQDGELRKGVVLSGERFTVNSHVDGDSVTDNLTTLVWAKDANLLFNRDLSFDTDGFGDPDGKISTKTALAYIDKLNTENFGGHNDWRLPNRNELMSLIDTERVDPALPVGHPFINVQNTVYGTNSADKGRPVSFTWLVDMKSGAVGTGYSDSFSSVNFWPVRGGSWSGPGGKAYLPATNQKLCYDYSSYSSSPVPCASTSGQDGNLQKGVVWPEFRFSDLGDGGSVRDTLTNLVWTASSNTPGPVACNPGVDRTWQEAFAYIACLNTNAYLGASNWRMPNRNELSSLSYIEGEFPPANHPFDVNNNYFLFHSSTPVAADNTTEGWSEEMNAWTVRMDGWISMQGKSAAYPVWPVRDFQIVLPATGQTAVYATGDDGSTRRGLTATPPRFNDLGNDTVYDTLTGLTWAKFVNADGPEVCVPYEPKDRAGAFAFINCLNSEVFLGYIDWRLPNRNELMSLVDSGQANSALPAGHPFQEMPAGGASFWTSSRGEFSDYGWYVDFSNGTTGPETFPGRTHHVWAVHEGDWEGPPTMAFIPATGQTTPDGTGSDGDLRLGVAWPAPRFSNNGNGTVTDNLTALIWSQDANTPDRNCNLDTTLTWSDALLHIACLNTNSYLGFSDWRLPNRREMASIIDMERRSPALPAGHPFNDVQNNFSYWSSTTAAADPTKAIVIGMGMGGESLWDKTATLPVWPIRGGFAPTDITKPVIESFTIPAFSRTLTVAVTTFTATDDVGVVDYCMRSINDSSGCIVWTSTPPMEYTFPTVGSKTLYAFARDAAGNISVSASATVFIDVMLPWVTSFVMPATSTSFTVPVTTLTGADNDQIAGYLINQSGVTPAANDPAWSATAPSFFTITGDGAGGYDLFAYAKDRAGNVSLLEETGWAPVIIDIYPPAITTFTMPAYYGSPTLTVPITLEFSDADNLGVNSVCFTETNDVATCNWQFWTGVFSHTFATAGAKTLYAFVADFAGTVSPSATATTSVSQYLPIAIPRTGQNASYVSGDDGALQAGIPWPETRFTDNGDATITDNLTTLIWSKNTAAWPSSIPACDEIATAGNNGLIGWYSALAHITCLNENNYLGYNDWRLPNINELESLSNFGNVGSSYIQGTVPFSPGSPFILYSGCYSSTTSEVNHDFALVLGDIWNKPVIDMVEKLFSIHNGYGSCPVRGGLIYDKQNYPYVMKTGQTISYAAGDDGETQAGLPVPPDDQRFINNNNGTAIDTFTDLIWTIDAAPEVTTCGSNLGNWRQALEYIACLNQSDYLGFSDWRLPNVLELKSLSKRAIYPQIFEAMGIFTNGKLTYWSADSNLPAGNMIPSSWVVMFGEGRRRLELQSEQYFVWPVRGGIFNDTQLPVITDFSVPMISAQLTVPITSFTATDNAVVYRYCLTESSDPTSCSWQYPAPTSYTFGSEWLKSLYAFVKDGSGNISITPTPKQILVDTTPPQIALFALQFKPPAGNLTLTVQFSLTNTLGVSDFCLTETANVASCNWLINSSMPTEYTFSKQGDNVLYAFARDTAGNVSAMATAAIHIADTIKPYISLFQIDQLHSSTTVPVIDFNVTDNLGVTGYCLTESNDSSTCVWQGTLPTSYTFATAGNKILYAFARDAAENVSLSTYHTSFIDLEIPSITAFSLPAYANTLTIAFTAFTATDNIFVAMYCLTETNNAENCTWQALPQPPASYTFSAPVLGESLTKTVYAFVKDTAGNISTSASASTTLDGTLPGVTAFTIPTLSATLEIPVTLTATDNIGIDGYCLTIQNSSAGCSWQPVVPTTFTFANSGFNVLHAFVKDVAGNVSQSIPLTSKTITIDTTAPQINTFTIPTLANSLTVTITQFTATDTMAITYCLSENSDPAGCSWSGTKPTTFTFSGTGSRTLHAFAKDVVGNISSPASRSIFIDTNPPVISSFSIPSTSDSLTVPVTIAATDDSGIVAGYCLREIQSIAGCTWDPTPPTSYTFSTDGTRSLYAFAIDAGGYVSSGRVASITIAAIQPVRIDSVTPVYYPTLQSAYNVAAASNVIQLKAGSLTNDLLANRDITVTLVGAAYATSTPNTVVRGVVRISAGKVIANKIAVAP